MAHVYAARHRNGRRFAIKFLRSELISEPSIVQRFLREGYIANKLEHPGAVTILDDDVTEDGAPFVVMELLIGRTLRARLDVAPLPLVEVHRIITQVLDVLASAHDKGIVHRDLKPDNLFETREGADRSRSPSFGPRRSPRPIRHQRKVETRLARVCEPETISCDGAALRVTKKKAPLFSCVLDSSQRCF